MYRYLSPAPTASPGLDDPRSTLVLWELGRMFNRGPQHAVGGTVLLAANDNALRLGVMARYRRWLALALPLDVAPGLVVLQTDQDLELEARLGLTGHMDASLRDWLGVFAQVE